MAARKPGGTAVESRVTNHAVQTSPEQLLDRVPFLLQLLQRGLQARLAEIADFETFDDLVTAVATGRRIAVNHTFGDSIAAVGWDAHADPIAVRCAVHPIS